MQNRPQEALEYLEDAVSGDPAHVKAFLYLGIVYQQLDRPDDAIAVYERILPRAGAEKARIAFNLGNVCFSKGDFDLARQYYTEAIGADPAYASAYLNRANTLVRMGDLEKAILDYEVYLSLEPMSPKRDEAMELIAFILDEFAHAEKERAVSRPEMDRRTRLILDVTESLRTVAEDSRGFSVNFDEEE